jgi:hypothetical protein
MKPNIKTFEYWPADKKEYERKVCALMRLGFKLKNACLPGSFWVETLPNGIKKITVGLEPFDDCQGQTVFNFCGKNKHCFNIPIFLT